MPKVYTIISHKIFSRFFFLFLEGGGGRAPLCPRLLRLWLNQMPTCKNWLILLFQKIDITTFCGSTWGIVPTTFWTWVRSPPWSRRLCTVQLYLVVVIGECQRSASGGQLKSSYKTVHCWPYCLSCIAFLHLDHYWTPNVTETGLH